VAQILSSGRTSDIACRYGGEEFGVILPNTGFDEAAEVAERHRVAIESQVWPIDPDLVVTTSIGVCELSSIEGPKSSESLVVCADGALYRAKERGRNCVHRYGLDEAKERRSGNTSGRAPLA